MLQHPLKELKLTPIMIHRILSLEFFFYIKTTYRLESNNKGMVNPTPVCQITSLFDLVSRNFDNLTSFQSICQLFYFTYRPFMVMSFGSFDCKQCTRVEEFCLNPGHVCTLQLLSILKVEFGVSILRIISKLIQQ